MRPSIKVAKSNNPHTTNCLDSKVFSLKLKIVDDYLVAYKKKE